jgi:hypothetical protein
VSCELWRGGKEKPQSEERGFCGGCLAKCSLRKAGLDNKNRGRDSSRWEEINPEDYMQDTAEEYDIRTPE